MVVWLVWSGLFCFGVLFRKAELNPAETAISIYKSR